jgi:hypothetical protein
MPWIVDSTRWMHKPTTYSSLEQALRRATDTRGQSRKWWARLRVAGDHHSLGLHRTREAAYAAYLAGKSSFHPFSREEG